MGKEELVKLIENSNFEAFEKKKEEPKYIEPLCTIKDLYIDATDFRLYLINKDNSKIRKLSNPQIIKPLTNEIPLLDVLYGVVDIGLSDIILIRLRQFFDMKKQIGYSPTYKYDFFHKHEINRGYNINNLLNFEQNLFDNNQFLDF